MSDVEQTVEVTPVVEETTPAVVEEVVAAEVAADEVEEGEAAAEGEGESAGKSQKATPPPSNKLFVGGIVEGVTEADIREFFARVPGEIQEISIHGRYGFVTFATEEDAKAATSLNGEQINGHVMQVEAKKRNNRRENNKRGRESNNNNNNNNANKGRGRDNQQSGAVTGDRVCFKCNKPGHVAARCRESERLCFHCQRPGHLARECPSAPGRQPFGDRFRDDSRGRRRDRSRSRRRDDSRDRRRYDSRDRRRDRSRSRRRDDSRDRRDDSRDDKKRRRL